MERNLAGIAVSVAFVALVMLLSTLLSKRGLLGPEGSRKLIHIGVSNWWLVAMAFFDSPIWAAAVPVLFIAVNTLSYRRGLISAMERQGEKDSLGTVFFPVSLTILSLVCFGRYSEPYIGGLGVLIMGWGDGLAAIIGMRFGKKSASWRLIRRKTPEGCLCMLAVSFAVAFLILSVYAPEGALPKALVLAVFATVVEAFSSNGTDNLTVPLLTPLFYQLILM